MFRVRPRLLPTGWILLLAFLSLALAAGPIDVVTLNTWGLPPPIAPDRAGRLPRIRAWLEATDADIVALQEVWDSAAPLLDLDGVRAPEDAGLQIVSRWPVHDPAFTAYAAERGLDAWKSKGFLAATVDTPDGPLRVVVTHLQAGSGSLNAEVRRDQVEQLLTTVRATPEPLLLLGDFNFYAEEPTDAGSAALLAADLLDAGSPGVTYDRLGEQFDRVWVRGTADAAVAPQSARIVEYDDDPSTSEPPLLSDHHPVVARISVRRRGP